MIGAVATQESMLQAVRSTRPGGHVGFVGVAHGVELSGLELFFSQVHLHGRPVPVCPCLPDLIGRMLGGTITPAAGWLVPCPRGSTRASVRHRSCE